MYPRCDSRDRDAIRFCAQGACPQDLGAANAIALTFIGEARTPTKAIGGQPGIVATDAIAPKSLQPRTGDRLWRAAAHAGISARYNTLL